MSIFSKFFGKSSKKRDFFTNEIIHMKFNISKKQHEPEYVSNQHEMGEKKMAYIHISESKKLIKIFINNEFDRLQKDLGAGLGKTRIFETSAFEHPSERLKILNKGRVNGHLAYTVKFEGRTDDRIVIEKENVIHLSEWDESINEFHKVRQFTGVNMSN